MALYRILLVALLLLLSPAAFAEVMLTNGDFESPADGDLFAKVIPGWGESEVDAFEDILLKGDQAGALNSGQTAGFSGAGYIYQEIGSPDGFGNLRVEGVNYWRSSTDEGDLLRVDVLWLPGNDPFEFAESGNDILGVGTSLGSSIVDAPPSAGEVVSFDLLFDLAELAPGSRLFLRLDQSPDATALYVFTDDLSVSLTNVPEPTSLGLFVAGGLCLLVARRRWLK